MNSAEDSQGLDVRIEAGKKIVADLLFAAFIETEALHQIVLGRRNESSLAVFFECAGPGPALHSQ